IRTLNISQNEITGEGLKHLQHIPIQGLAMYVTRLDDEHMKYIKPFTSLGFLDIRGSKVTDAGLAEISDLTKISYLRLNNLPGVTDAAVVHLKKLTNLEILSLSNTGVTDAVIADLKTMPKLAHVELKRTKVTRAGLQELKQALPNLKIESDGDGVAAKPR